MFGIAPHQFLANLRVPAFPEAGEISCRLDGALVGSQQEHHYRHLAVGYFRRVFHAEEILQARRQARGLVINILKLGAAAVGQLPALWGEFVQEAAVPGQAGFQVPDQSSVLGFLFEFMKRALALREFGEGIEGIVFGPGGQPIGVFGGEAQPCEEGVHFFYIGEADDAGFAGFLGKEGRGEFGIDFAAAAFFDREAIVEHRTHRLHALTLAIPFDGGLFGDVIGVEID